MPTWILKKTDCCASLKARTRCFPCSIVDWSTHGDIPESISLDLSKLVTAMNAASSGLAWQCVSSCTVAKSGQTWADCYTAGITVWLVLSFNPSSTQNCHLTGDSLEKARKTTEVPKVEKVQPPKLRKSEFKAKS